MGRPLPRAAAHTACPFPSHFTYMETDGVSWALAVPGVVSMPFCAELEPDQSHELRRSSPHFASEGRRHGTLVW